MKIAFDGRRIREGMSGLGVYSLRLMQALIEELTDDEVVTYVLPESERFLKPPAEPEYRVIVPYPVEDHVRGEWWKHMMLPVDLDRKKVDVFHDPAYQLPLRTGRYRRVVSILDLAPFRFPETNTWKYNTYWKWMTRASARRADAIIVPSHAIRQEVIEYLAVPENRICVIHHAASSEFCVGGVDRRILDQYGIRPPYLVTTAKFEPRKNLERYLRAFHQVIHQHRLDCRLVVIGQLGWKCGKIRQLFRTLDFRDHLIVTGYIPTGDLVQIIRGAEMAVVPSVYEGFGYPVLEAMNCGTPVLASRIGSLMEVGGDAPRYCDPWDIADMAEQTVDLLKRPQERQEMRRLGLLRSRIFSWRVSAKNNISLYQMLC